MLEASSMNAAATSEGTARTRILAPLEMRVQHNRGGVSSELQENPRVGSSILPLATDPSATARLADLQQHFQHSGSLCVLERREGLGERVARVDQGLDRHPSIRE